MSEAEASPSLLARARTLWANPQIRYPLLVLVYLLLIGSVFNAALADLRGGPLRQLEEFTAASVYYFVRAFTELTTHRGTLVTLDGFAVSIILECVGLLEMLIYSACVLAFPAPFRTRLYGIVLGCAAIFIFNVMRIATLLVVGRHWSSYFDFFHLYFWQATLIAMIVSVLYGWIKLFVRR